MITSDRTTAPTSQSVYHLLQAREAAGRPIRVGGFFRSRTPFFNFSP